MFTGIWTQLPAIQTSWTGTTWPLTDILLFLVPILKRGLGRIKVAPAGDLMEMFSFSVPSPWQYEEGKKRRKPNYSSVDLSEVEWEDRDDVVSDLFSSLVRRAFQWAHFCTWRLPQEPARGLPEGHLPTRGTWRQWSLLRSLEFYNSPAGQTSCRQASHRACFAQSAKAIPWWALSLL